MHRLWLTVLVAVAVLGAGMSEAQAEEIKIGAILRLSQGASDGLPAKRGIEIAVREINAAGGIGGKQLKVIYEDEKDSAPASVAAYQKLVSMDKVKVIIGPMMSGNVLAVAPLAQREKIVIVTPNGTSPKISDAGEYVYRGCTRIDKQAEALTKYAKENLKTTKPAILYSNEPYGKGCNDLFSKFFAGLGIPVVATESFMVGDRDFSAQLTKLKQKSFDLLFIPGYLQETAPAISQARRMGITAQSMGVFGDMAPKYIELAGKASEGHLNCSEYDEDYNTPTNKRFKDAYYRIVKADPKEPNNIMFAAITYDMTRMVAKAIAAKGGAPDQVRSYLDTVKDFDGVTGKLSFDKNGDVVKQGVYLFRVTGGKYVKVK
ncbi:MAG TPA: ABC transporter substrate-binding protein [Deltaproteobacteria bacterium]|nr:ABC transporter substrate-binding protein [Deltaproteobacteria bacterium]